MTITPNMGLILPDVGVTTGPEWATLLNQVEYVVDSHDHSTGNGVRVTPSGLNISSDLTFAQNNATNLRSARLFNNTSFTPAITDKTCLYALNNELYYIDGAGNNVQITLNGALDISASISSLTLNDSAFTLQYFGDTSKKMRFDASLVPSATTRIFSVPATSIGTDVLVTNTSTSTMTNKTLTAATISGSTATNLVNGSGQTNFPSSGTITIPNGTDTLVNLTSAQTLTNKIIPTINTGSVTFTLPVSDGSTGQVIGTNGSGTLSFISVATTVANVAAQDSNVVFTNADNRQQVVLPTAARTYTLPTTSIVSGDTWYFENRSLFLVTLNSSGGNFVSFVYPQAITKVISLVATPTTAANWSSFYDSPGQSAVAAQDSAVVFTISDNKTQVVLPTAARTYTLPTTSVPVGDTWTFINRSLFLITINSSGGNLVGYVYPNSILRCTALISTPTTAANWSGSYDTPIPAMVVANDATTSFLATDNRTQICTVTANRTYTLPTTGIPSGDIWTFYNQGTSGIISLNASDASLVVSIPPKGFIRVSTLQATPTTNTHWLVMYENAELIRGNATQTSPTPGFIGESVVSVQSSYVSAGATTVAKTVTSISLTAGIWDVSATSTVHLNGATMSGAVPSMYISLTSNSILGTTFQDTWCYHLAYPTGATEPQMTLPVTRITTSSTISVFLVIVQSYSAGTPQMAGKITGTRVG